MMLGSLRGTCCTDSTNSVYGTCGTNSPNGGTLSVQIEDSACSGSVPAPTPPASSGGGTFTSPGGSAPPVETTGACVTSDPGFMVGLESWGDFPSWSNNISDITSIPTWMCYPMMNLGIVAAPLVAIASAVFFLGRATKRGR